MQENNVYRYQFDKTYYYNKMVSEPSKTECLYCDNGQITRFVDKIKAECPICKGSGKIESGYGSIKEVPTKCFLDEIISKITKDSSDIEYRFVDDGGMKVVAVIYDDLDKCVAGKLRVIMGYTP